MDDLETSSKEIDPFDKFIIQNIKKNYIRSKPRTERFRTKNFATHFKRD